MKGKITKIHPLKVSRNGNAYKRIEFELEDGSCAKTDLCPDFRNYSNWKLIINDQDNCINNYYKGLKLRRANEVDGDSKPLPSFN